MTELSRFTKDPDARLDYKFDWRASTNGTGDSDWLVSGETISSYTITPEDGITVDDDDLSDSNTSVTVWLTGGIVGRLHRVTCHIVTSEDREDDRTITVRVIER